jgi:hypothetical protein
VDLGSLIQSNIAGTQAGEAASYGLKPNPIQPRGSPQLWVPSAIAATRSEILNLNKLADSLRRVGEEQCDREVIACTHKLQGVLEKLKGRLSDMQEGAMNNAA